MAQIERYTYTNEKNESINFSSVGIYHANQVSGVNDMHNTIYTISSMGQDGDTVVATRIESRDIEIIGSINAQDKEIVNDYRRNLYHIMNPQLKATLTYSRGGLVRVIDCVPDNTPVFTRKAVLQDFTIQLRCPYPFWRDAVETVNDIAAWVGDFQFPAKISLETGIQFGHREPSLIVDVVNSGDVKAGMKVEFRAVGTVVNPSLLNIDTLEFIRINHTLQAGEAIIVSTGYGQKSVNMRHGNTQADAFRYLDPDSTYIQLDVGSNLFRYDAQEGLLNLEVSIYHTNNYLGV